MVIIVILSVVCINIIYTEEKQEHKINEYTLKINTNQFIVSNNEDSANMKFEKSNILTEIIDSSSEYAYCYYTNEENLIIDSLISIKLKYGNDNYRY